MLRMEKAAQANLAIAEERFHSLNVADELSKKWADQANKAEEHRRHDKKAMEIYDVQFERGKHEQHKLHCILITFNSTQQSLITVAPHG